MPNLLTLVSATTCLALIGGVRAQCPPGAPMPRDVAMQSAAPAANGPAAVRWQLGRKAIAAGDLDAAQAHLLQALQIHPASADILFDLVRAAGANVDQQQLWLERFVRAAADTRGKVKLDRDRRRGLPKSAALEPAQKLAAARAQAIAEVARFAQKQRPNGRHDASLAQLSGFAADLLLALGEGAPAPLAAIGDKVQAHCDSIPPAYRTVFDALLAVLRRAPEPDEDQAVLMEQRIRAARILVGLARQAAFKDLQGPPPPDFANAADAAREFLADLDAEVQGVAKVWTIDELAAMSPEQRVRFTEEHDHWQHPAVALSTTGKYRIETTCGHGTLLGAARTVELHHARLVDHFGKDPFTDRQGIIRIVPEHAGLETEGAPYWWAAGFQSGDRTTVRFAWGTIPGLGRLLTHELTHRFDGVLRPFLRSWYVEGHAVWTAAHYARMADPRCIEDFLALGSVDSAWRKNYGNREKLEQLLRGEIEEYRDNYPAGYALYSYLRGYLPKQDSPFLDELARYEQNARAGQRDPVDYFTKTFCDGDGGRPASFEEFVEGWQTFLRGVGMHLVDRRVPEFQWAGRYGGRDSEGGPQVADRPTWSWERERAEPFFGQDHAAKATLLLHAVGADEAVIAAGMWSIAVDGWQPEVVLAVVESSRSVGRPAAAQAFTALARRRYPWLPPSSDTPLAAQLPRTVTFVQALGERAHVQHGAGASIAAAALAAAHDDLAARLDLPRLTLEDAPELAASAPPPVPTWLGGHGWTESSLVSHDRRRQLGLWYETPEGDVHVGRNKPRDGTGSIDRRAHQRDAFVRAVSWQAPGAYVLRGRVHFTTSYARGAIVFGMARRDRHLRLEFASGDFNYAVGRSDDNRNFDRVRFRLRGLWERDPEMPGTPGGFSTEVADDAAWFDYELQIRGPRVLIRINDDKPQAYAMHDGAPIEGYTGFATGMGAIRVQQPTVQRLDLRRDGAMVGLDLARQPLVPIESLLALPVAGLPIDPRGTLVLWVPRSDDQPEVFTMATLPRALPQMARPLNTPHLHPQPWVIAVPHDLPAEYRIQIQSQVAEIHGSAPPIVEHRVDAPFTGTYPWVLFVDGFGLLRAAAEVSDPRFHSRVQGWSRRFRRR